MKILQINNFHYMRGGSETMFFNTSELLEEAGHVVVPFCARSDVDLPSPYSDYFPLSADLQAMRPTDFPRFLHNRHAASALERLLADHGPFDLAHLHIYYGRLTTAILPVLERAGIPIVQTLHEYKLVCPVYTLERDGKPCRECVGGGKRSLLRHRCKNGSLVQSAAMYLEARAARLKGDVDRIDRFICISAFQHDIMLEGGLPGAKLETLHNFVDVERARPVHPDEKEDYLLYFGRIERLKGVPTLIEAVRRTGQRLKIAGQGTWEPEMRKAIADLPQVEHLGFVSGTDLQDLVARARAVVVPSEWYEPFGLTTVEAKAAATPVIASRIGASVELVREGTDGFLFEPGDVADLVSVLKRLDVADIAEMANAAREDVLARFTPQIYLRGLLATYRELIEKGAGHG